MILRESVGARVLFSQGAVRLAPATPVPAGWAVARFSLISPGTELRRLAGTVAGKDHAAGYMTVVRSGSGSGLRLAPVPHGAAVDNSDCRALPIPAGASIEHVAVARFQLMAALGISRCASWLRGAAEVLVVGAGPVAVGCVLELRRAGVPRIAVVTRHPKPAIAKLGDITVSPEARAGGSHIVMDCTGRTGHALRMVAPGGLLGLLGTPAEGLTLPSADVHRGGITIVGMHELTADLQDVRLRVFETVLRWAATQIDIDVVRSWCHIIPGDQAVRLYDELRGACRPPTPFLILEW